MTEKNQPGTTPEGDAVEAFVSTLGDEPETTRVLNVPEVIPVMAATEGGTADAGDSSADPATMGSLGEMPLEGSDAEAYEALKKRRAERRHKKMVRRGIILGSLAGVLVLGGAAIALLNRPADPGALEPITDMAFTGTFSDQIDVSGTLQPLSSTVVSPEIDGQILTVNVAEGQAVKKGDVLFTIKNDELDRAVAQAERELNMAKQGLKSAKEAAASGVEQVSLRAGRSTAKPRLIAARAPLPGSSALHQTGGAKPGSVAAGNTNLSPQEYEATFAVEVAQEAYDLAVAKAAQRTVKAPCDGSIVALNVQVGAKLSDLAAGGGNGASGGPLVQIADLSKMKVTVQVGEEDIASVEVDQTANIMFPAFEGLMLNGRVTGIASIASSDGASYNYDGSTSPTFAVDILIDAPDARLKPGMTAEVSVVTTQLDNVVMVPVSALQTDDGENYYVNVLPDPESNEPERRDVTVTVQNDDMAVVGKPQMANLDENTDIPTSPIADGELLLIAGGMASMGDAEMGVVEGVDGGMAVM